MTNTSNKKESTISEFPLKLTELAQQIAAQTIQPGDFVIDATVGNGEDTLHLARCVGDKGKVLGFDIQDLGLKKTERLLIENGLEQRVRLVCSSHQNIGNHCSESPSVIMFNLGYLPGGSSDIHTKAETTLRALEESCRILAPGGMISLCLYNHREGLREKQAVIKWIDSLPKFFQVLHIVPLKRNKPPELFVIKNTKIRSRDER